MLAFAVPRASRDAPPASVQLNRRSRLGGTTENALAAREQACLHVNELTLLEAELKKHEE
jgi:hypothetical protein